MQCKKCGNLLAGKQTSYCSKRCSKLHLKSLWRKRNKDRIREYNQQYRSKAIDAYFVRSEKQRGVLKALMPKCQRCSTEENLQLCHIKPHWAKGTNELHNFIVLCGKCHHEFDEALRKFWANPKYKLVATPPKADRQ